MLSQAACRSCGCRRRCGFDFVLPDDVKEVALPVLGHRLVLRPESRLRKATAAGVVAEVLDRVPVPTVTAGGMGR